MLMTIKATFILEQEEIFLYVQFDNNVVNTIGIKIY